MRIIFFACSESISNDRDTNRLSVFHIIEHFSAPSYPATANRMTISALVEKESDDEDDNGRVDVEIALDELTILRHSLEFVFGKNGRAKLIINASQFVIPSPGRLSFKVVPPGREAAVWSLNAIQRPAKAEPQQEQTKERGA